VMLGRARVLEGSWERVRARWWPVRAEVRERGPMVTWQKALSAVAVLARAVRGDGSIERAGEVSGHRVGLGDGQEQGAARVVFDACQRLVLWALGSGLRSRW